MFSQGKRETPGRFGRPTRFCIFCGKPKATVRVAEGKHSDLYVHKACQAKSAAKEKTP